MKERAAGRPETGERRHVRETNGLAQAACRRRDRQDRRGGGTVQRHPATLTRDIARLEERFGGRLFERLPHGVRPTSLGATAVERARRILHEVEERYIHEAEEIDPLIRLAVMHYQFEAIHPFVDGNGRTGRVLNLLYLVDKGLLDVPVLYLSRHIIRNKAQYYRYLLEVTTRQDWEAWILFILEAVRTTAEWTTAKIRAIRELLDETAAAIRQGMPKIYSRELAELIFVNPYCRISDVVEADIAKRQTAAVYLKALAAEGLLEEIKAGRENLYINPPLLALLSERA